MKTDRTEINETASPGFAHKPRRYDWIPVMRLEPGTIIARPVMGGPGHQMTIYLPAKTVVTPSIVSQLVNKGVFGAEPDESCRPLYDALREDGP